MSANGAPRQGAPREGHGVTRPTTKDIKAVAEIAGVRVDDEIATRISNSMGPAFEGFAAIAGTLPLDLEPALYLLAQTEKVSK